jgi:hypothetical protein
VSKFLIVVPVILGVSLLSMIYFVRELYHEFGWAVFHAIGADPRMKGTIPVVGPLSVRLISSRNVQMVPNYDLPTQI